MDGDECERSVRRKKRLSGIKSQMKNMPKEAVNAALLKKKECNDKAQQVVHLLIEREVSEEVLLSNLFHINKTHYEDVIVERAVAKLCGYPLCSSDLVNVPSKMYHVSTKLNKVYDITERKNYCSNLCFKAGNYLKDQLYTSPLWLRDQEVQMDFKLLTQISGSDGSGEEVLSYKPLSVEDSDSDKKCDKGLANKGSRGQEEKPLLEERPLADPTEPSTNEVPCTTSKSNINPPENRSNKSIGEMVENPQPTDTFPILKRNSEGVKKKTKTNDVEKKKSLHSVMIKMENTIRTWFTFDTATFILGEKKVKEELIHLGLQVASIQEKADPYFIDRYNELCRRVNMMELKDTYGTAKDIPSNPTPTDFKKLKEEAKELEIKVKSFYRGDMTVKFKLPENEYPEDEPLPVLPIIDHHSAHITRRNIVLQKITRALPEIQLALGIARFNFRDQVKEFVSTLNLTASNISLRPFEWNIATIVIIKLFSLQNYSLRTALEVDGAQKYLKLIFKSYELDIGYLDRLVWWLMDFNYLVTTYVETSFHGH